jgi:hypothetical protein
MTPWLAVSGAGVLAAAVTVTRHWLVVRRYRRSLRLRLGRGMEICFYLHENYVMNLYLQGEYEALNQEIEETRRSGSHIGANADIGVGLAATAGRESVRETVSRYIKNVGPISVIGLIVREMERKNEIAYANLSNSSFEPNRGLDEALRSTGGDEVVPSARLSELGPFVFVSLMGRFEKTDNTEDPDIRGETTTLFASYGPENEKWQVKVTCGNDQFLENVPSGGFWARCVGRIQGFDPATRELVMDPVLAIYR